MKVIFLDFDGVLNGADWLRKTQNGNVDPAGYAHYINNPCDPELVSRLNRIVATTNAKIVISSSWRIGYTLAALRGFLKKAGFEHPHSIYDRTPRLNGADDQRGDEIQAWLDRYIETEKHHVETYVILDDDSDMKHLKHKLVQTNTLVGLQDEHVDRAIAILMETTK